MVNGAYLFFNDVFDLMMCFIWFYDDAFLFFNDDAFTLKLYFLAPHSN